MRNRKKRGRCVPVGQRVRGRSFCCKGSKPVRANQLGHFKYCLKQQRRVTNRNRRRRCVPVGHRVRGRRACCNGSKPVRANQLGRFKYCLKEGHENSQHPKNNGPHGDRCDGLGIILRKNVKSMSQTEWDDYVRAFNILVKTPEPGGSGMSLYEQFAFDHDRLASGSYGFHGNEYFLAWHRHMLWKWDVALNAAVPGVTQPYFEWSVSADALFEDPMFAPNRFGGRVAQTNKAHTSILNGAFKDLRSSWPEPHLVTRNFNFDPLANKQLIDRIIHDVDVFRDFSATMEFGVHNAFHRAIGGDMVTPFSPNEPLFYFHHAYIDLLYRKWENRHGIDTSSVVNPNRRMIPWSETTTKATSGKAKRCVSYESLESSARFAVLDRQSVARSGVKFETASEKAAALEVVSEKKVSDPKRYKETVKRWRKASAAAAEAAVLLHEDLSKLASAQKIIATLLLKDGVVDMAGAEKVSEETEEEVRADGVEELAVLQTGELPSFVSTEDVGNVAA